MMLGWLVPRMICTSLRILARYDAKQAISMYTITIGAATRQAESWTPTSVTLGLFCLKFGVQVLVATSRLDGETFMDRRKKVEKGRKTVSGPFEMGDVMWDMERVRRT